MDRTGPGGGGAFSSLFSLLSSPFCSLSLVSFTHSESPSRPATLRGLQDGVPRPSRPLGRTGGHDHDVRLSSIYRHAHDLSGSGRGEEYTTLDHSSVTIHITAGAVSLNS